MQFVDLQAQYIFLKTSIDNAIRQTLESATFIQGEQVHKLEEELCEYSGAKHTITCANGTDAIQIALMALGIGAGDAVLTTNFSFIGTAEPIALLGATPVFCDIDPKTFNISIADLEQTIINIRETTALNIRAIIAVDIFGSPADYEPLQEVAHRYGLTLISDAAQSLGAEYKNRKIGGVCEITTTSFFPAKPLGCYGDGGAIFCSDAPLAATMRSIAAHGKGSHKYNHVRVGLNSRLDSLQAAILSVKLQNLDREIERRNQIADHLLAACSSTSLTPQSVPSFATSAYAQFSIKAPANQRSEIITHLNKQGIPTQIYYPSPLSSFDIWNTQEHKTTPITYNLCENIFSIPVHPYLSDYEVETLAKALKSIQRI
ncbi:DegT/DnrJ/EryC1/StrS family aminotransferase [Saccharophagus degradans]|uniref:DegT/DnrJ/EryC1/StrS aminotransferase n=1 Tax=Saccharophagus degradans (strain 2-40 / ATCC 43961 / DSM 17024) TaxID=203122 RepID=Q21ME8_SACD2|nr:DegT/DnrJ/EryC1/StrS family aminotransferase [Saccharophagus degradans]ABD80131.1 DegT/DnrJ/EryC1/StrS aminotransferase [Saccharophagus degradans 2-40]